MKLLSQITIQRSSGKAFVQLLQGDLSSIPEEHETDILVISAYPGDYTPLEGSLMGALFSKGLNVGELSLSKAVDLRSQLHCWLSNPLSKDLQDRLNVRRLLCFEPGNMLEQAETVVGNIFRCINAFAFEEHNNVVALPIVAAGHQKVPLERVFPVMVDSAIFWLENGLPLQCIKLVVYRDEQVPQALKIFEKARKRFDLRTASTKRDTVEKAIGKLKKPVKNSFNRAKAEDDNAGRKQANTAGQESASFTSRGGGNGNTESTFPPMPPQASAAPQAAPSATAPSPRKPITNNHEYDYFISYAHTHSNLINSFVSLVKSKNNQLNIFYDRDSIPAGSQWIRQLSGAIQKAKKVLIFLSPDYDKSPVCWDEFQCAKLMEYNRRQQIIQTIYLYDYKDIEMPPIMGIYSYIDCREGDEGKLEKCIQKIIAGQ